MKQKNTRFRSFEKPDTKRHTEKRSEMAYNLILQLMNYTSIQTVIDLGCGPGLMSPMLRSLDLNYLGVDTRKENVREAAHRYPENIFKTASVENTSSLGTFDLTFCYGLLYHMENPILVLRNMRSITKSILLLETEIIPLNYPGALLFKRKKFDVGGATELAAFVPSLSGLIYMLYHVDFPYVYIPTTQPNHEYFRESSRYFQKRIVMLASLHNLDIQGLTLMSKPEETPNTIITKKTIRNKIIQSVHPLTPQPLRKILRKFI